MIDFFVNEHDYCLLHTIGLLRIFKACLKWMNGD
jgi:hypothetical protein